jgi:SagB-type dehydrogenase family enzyme
MFESPLCRFALTVVLASFSANLAMAEESKPIALPKPQTDGGKPLMQALKDRKSSREFSTEKLSPQMLSDLLWAAFGISRPDTGKRTAPSAMNWQEIDIYAATADGLFLFDAKTQTLYPQSKQDIRAATGMQPFVKDAAVNLVYVADLARVNKASPEEQTIYTAVDTGAIVENVYLFCASAGLAVVVRGSVDRPALTKLMNLKSEQRIILAQSIGYPKK